jgi:hypothetical protein
VLSESREDHLSARCFKRAKPAQVEFHFVSRRHRKNDFKGVEFFFLRRNQKQNSALGTLALCAQSGQPAQERLGMQG